AGAALVDEVDSKVAGEERRLAEALGEGGVVEREFLEDLVVGEEGDRRAGLLARRSALQVALRRASLVVLGPDVAVAADLQMEALRQRVDDRDADAVEATRHLVAATVAELAAGVERGEDDLRRRPLLLGML